ncbi:MAG: glutamine--fructose-6-phosphate transaminase (isomerizing) [Gammaproteobacteria bacterium]|nr:glutamine--fructose-6-phosphate transaminase (isomerizing) [Gammaproteobacteria bacterium]
MCGIVGAIANHDVVPTLIDGLKRLEYRGYDSAGVTVLKNGSLERARAVGKVDALERVLEFQAIHGTVGIAHTRWATHGEPSEKNAHPHVCRNRVAVVHNGIIENYELLREQQLAAGYEFTSDTDTEVIVHQIHHHLEHSGDLLMAVTATARELEGAFALGVVSTDDPTRIVAARRGSPLVVGLRDDAAFLASDMAALVSVTQHYLVLEDGDVADITCHGVAVCDARGSRVERAIHKSRLTADAVELGEYRHYMLKEIFEQPKAIADTLEGRVSNDRVLEAGFGPNAEAVFDATDTVQIVACGTSYHAGLVAKYWMESLGVGCNVEVASEFRYRRHVVPERSLLVAVSQSGETADTLAALKEAKRIGYTHALAICNVPESSLVRASDLVFMTRAGPEIGVASSKAFTTQLVALLLLSIVMQRRQGLTPEQESKWVHQLRGLPTAIEHVLGLDVAIHGMAEQFADKHHALFLGRGAHYPIALEGALKLKEISYIHAEAYPAGELKHGPLALVDSAMPVVAVAPNNQLLEKLKSNIQEVRARGGKLIVFADRASGMETDSGLQVIEVAPVDDRIAPIIYTIPLQLLAYHVAVIKGTDVDKPRNLAKSVTVE